VRWRVQEIGVVSSTQDEAGRLAIEGAAEGTVVVARKQTSGRGRFDRSWESPEGGLYMSLILRPEVEEAMSLSFVGALAIVDGIAEQTRLAPRIRWPNDIILNGKKAGGVIAQASFSGKSLSFVILGIGVNCNFRAGSLGSLSKMSTSLREILKKDVDIASLRREALDSFGRLYSLLQSGQNREVVSRIRSVLSTIGRSVIYETVGGRRGLGVAEGMLDDGSLRVIERGQIYDLRPEEIRWLREE
jgi:BirA family biotin operon repressor/biotin-[acetyl-CoA-carboxylase] ligase